MKTTCLMADNVIWRCGAGEALTRAPSLYPRDGEGVEKFTRDKTHRWLSIPEQPPIDFGEPFMLFDLTRSTLTPYSCKFVLVKQLDDDILARSKYWANDHQLAIQDAVYQPAEALSSADRYGTTALGHHTSHTREKRGLLGQSQGRRCGSK